jgi:dTDP-4-dehydrorhamnose 3,5-epimerase-like enzyme
MKNEARDEARAAFEEMVAATAIHYFNAANASFTDDALRSHTLSEAIAFTRALHYNQAATISFSDIQDVLVDINAESNLYEVTQAQITAARDKLAAAAGLEDVKGQL